MLELGAKVSDLIDLGGLLGVLAEDHPAPSVVEDVAAFLGRVGVVDRRDDGARAQSCPGRRASTPGACSRGSRRDRRDEYRVRSGRVRSLAPPHRARRRTSRPSHPRARSAAPARRGWRSPAAPSERRCGRRWCGRRLGACSIDVGGGGHRAIVPRVGRPVHPPFSTSEVWVTALFLRRSADSRCPGARIASPHPEERGIRMIHLAQFSIRRPKLALAVWGTFAAILVAIGLGVTDRLSPTMTFVPGTESTRAEELAESQFGPSTLVPILLTGPQAAARPPGPARSCARSSAATTRASCRPGTPARPAPPCARRGPRR